MRIDAGATRELFGLLDSRLLDFSRLPLRPHHLNAILANLAGKLAVYLFVRDQDLNFSQSPRASEGDLA